jgi:hypothetical protein
VRLSAASVPPLKATTARPDIRTTRQKNLVKSIRYTKLPSASIRLIQLGEVLRIQLLCKIFSMRSEFQFFMTAKDEAEFVSFAEYLADRVDRESDTQWFFWIGDCSVQFLRSRVRRRELISGRIALATSGFGLVFDSAADGERLYKRLRAWLKKSYNNELTCRNSRIDNSKMEIKNFWVSSRVIALLREEPDLSLKQIPESFVVFEPKQEAQQAGSSNSG